MCLIITIVVVRGMATPIKMETGKRMINAGVPQRSILRHEEMSLKPSCSQP